MSYRFVTKAINLLVFNKGQIEIGGEFLTEGKTFGNTVLSKVASFSDKCTFCYQGGNEILNYYCGSFSMLASNYFKLWVDFHENGEGIGGRSYWAVAHFLALVGRCYLWSTHF